MAVVKGSHQILMPFYVRPDLHHIFFVARTQTYITLKNKHQQESCLKIQQDCKLEYKLETK